MLETLNVSERPIAALVRLTMWDPGANVESCHKLFWFQRQVPFDYVLVERSQATQELA